MMKRSLVAACILTSVLAGSAMAADMPTKAYRSASPEVFSWSGFYVGGHLGYGLSSNEWVIDQHVLPPFKIGSGTINGALGGVQAGVNWQTGAIVFGVEADFSLADMSGETCSFPLVGAAFRCSSKVDRFGTITGRIGGAFERTLFYLKAGGAWAHDTHSLGVALIEFTPTSKSKWGWTGGGGVEYAITRNWSAKLEYDFLLFDAQRYAFTLASVPPFDADIKQRVHTIKLGFNYRFDWGNPVVAK